MSSSLAKAVCIMGPTASGKTDLAIFLTEHFPFEIISVDSAMVYRGLNIGSAKPSAEELAKAPHRLIDIVDPLEVYSAAQFREDALREMDEIVKAGRIPLLVGGTMLYFRALLQGLSELPAADDTTRQKLERETEELGLEKMHQRLAEVDPEAAARIHPNDPQRIQRALEVFEVTGKPMSQLQKEQQSEPIPYQVLKLGLLPSDRAFLHQRIEKRFKLMLEQGLIEEVKALLESLKDFPNQYIGLHIHPLSLITVFKIALIRSRKPKLEVTPYIQLTLQNGKIHLWEASAVQNFR